MQGEDLATPGSWARDKWRGLSHIARATRLTFASSSFFSFKKCADKEAREVSAPFFKQKASRPTLLKKN